MGSRDLYPESFYRQQYFKPVMGLRVLLEKSILKFKSLQGLSTL